MKLQDQVCTELQADRLKELGVAQESLFYHTHSEKWGVMPKSSIDFSGDPSSAFTVAELSIMLPDYYPSWRFKVSESSQERKWIATVICSPKPPGVDDIHTAHEFDRYAKTQAEALATLLIALLETETITAEEVNARLCA